LTNLKQPKSKNSEPGSLFLIVRTVLLGLAFAGCQPQAPERVRLVLSGPIMGTNFRITLVHDGEVDKKHIENVSLDAMQSVNQSMSNYLPMSELSQFNKLKSGEPQQLSPDFAQVVRESVAISVMSDGAFDITLAPAIDVWGFGPQGTITERPSAESLLRLKKITGYTKLSLDGDQLSKQVDGLEINLSAIAKGYAIDKVAQALTLVGITDFLINIGGELKASGTSPNGQLWKVGIEKPHILGGVEQIAYLDNAAIATSGDYRNYLLIDDQQFSHTINPQTLEPIFHKLALVSVISDNASTADALATAMMAMGEKRAWSFAQENSLAAYLVIRSAEPGRYETKVTEKFRVNLQ